MGPYPALVFATRTRVPVRVSLEASGNTAPTGPAGGQSEGAA
jgi:hypothetical protein